MQMEISMMVTLLMINLTDLEFTDGLMDLLIEDNFVVGLDMVKAFGLKIMILKIMKAMKEITSMI